MYLVKSPDHGAKPGGDATSIAGRNTGTGNELAWASGEVIARRLDLGVSGVANPANADYGELARIVPEKSEAISACAVAVIDRSGKVAERVAKFAAEEVLLASRAWVALAGCRTPGALAVAQQGLFLAWAARVLSRATALGALAMLSHGAAMAPFHSAATANAERLSRYPGATRSALGH